MRPRRAAAALTCAISAAAPSEPTTPAAETPVVPNADDIVLSTRVAGGFERTMFGVHRQRIAQ